MPVAECLVGNFSEKNQCIEGRRFYWISSSTTAIISGSLVITLVHTCFDSRFLSHFILTFVWIFLHPWKRSPSLVLYRMYPGSSLLYPFGKWLFCWLFFPLFKLTSSKSSAVRTSGRQKSPEISAARETGKAEFKANPFSIYHDDCGFVWLEAVLSMIDISKSVA